MIIDDHNRRGHPIGDAGVAEYSGVDDQADSEYGFVICIVLLLVLAWIAFLLFSSAMIVVPNSLGRALLNAIPCLPFAHGIKCNDNNYILGNTKAILHLWSIINIFFHLGESTCSLLVFSDLLAFSVGCYIIWAVVAEARYLTEYIKTQGAPVLVSQIWKWCIIVLQSSALLSIWVTLDQMAPLGR